MGTHSSISIQNLDGSVTGIYCHWDGYVEHNGKLLINHYNSFELALALVSLGDLSVLAEEIGKEHSFDQPTKGWCVAYGRDRGETGVGATTRPTLEDYCNDNFQQYNYHFKDDTWFRVRSYGRTLVPLKELVEANEKETED